MARRALSGQERTWLLGELEVWRGQGLVSQDQAVGILDLYETHAEAAERKRSVAVFALMGVAAFLVGLGALLLIGYNWEALPSAFKLVIIFGVIAGTYASAFHLRYRRGAQTLSEIVFFLGCLFYGAGIALIAQIFHINAHYPDGIWWWALGVLPISLCLDTLLLHALLVALLALWGGTEVLGFGNLGGWLFGRWGFLPNGAYSLPLLALPGLLWAYRKGSPTTVGLYAALLAWWVVLQPFAWGSMFNPVYFIGSVGALFLIIAECHAAGSPFAIPYRLFGMLLSGGVLVALSFHEVNAEMGGIDEARSLLQTLAIVGLSVVVIVVAALVKRHQEGGQGALLEQARDLVQRQLLPVALLGFMILASLWSGLFGAVGGLREAALLPTILANVGMIASALRPRPGGFARPDRRSAQT